MTYEEDLKRYNFHDISILESKIKAPLIVLHMADTPDVCSYFLYYYLENHSFDFTIGKNNNGEYGFKLDLIDFRHFFIHKSKLTNNNYPPLSRIITPFVYLTVGCYDSSKELVYDDKLLELPNPFLNMN